MYFFIFLVYVLKIFASILFSIKSTTSSLLFSFNETTEEDISSEIGILSTRLPFSSNTTPSDSPYPLYSILTPKRASICKSNKEISYT